MKTRTIQLSLHLFKLLYLLPLLGLLVSTNVRVAAQDSPEQAPALIEQARQAGANYLQSKDKKAKEAAKKNLERAEKILRNGFKQDANCEKCMENLVVVYFYQSYFGVSGDYGECIKTAKQGLERFPANGYMAFIKGFAHYNLQQYGEASKAFSRYLASKPGNSPTEQQARAVLQDTQQRFLTLWYRQADFYNSIESRIEQYSGFQKVVLFQVTPEWELGLGARAFAQLTQASPTLQDPEVQTYVESLVTRLTSRTRGPAYNFKVTILNSPLINAVTVPGHVFVYTGLLASVESEAELAGVLGHEIAHTYGHHAARRFIKAYHAQMIAAAIAAAINPQGQVAQLATQLTSQIGINLFLLAYDRHEEKEADLYGAHLMFNAGYNPTSLSEFFLKMYKANAKQPITFFSTHPPYPDRATYLTDYLESFPLDREMQIDSRAFQQMKSKLAPLIPTQRN